MKRIISLAVAVAALSVSAFGQEGLDTWNGNRRMAITLNPGPLIVSSTLNGFGVDVGFEYATSQSVSVKANSRFAGVRGTDYYGDDPADDLKGWLLRLGLGGRWYPQGRFAQGWFFSVNLQYQTANGSYVTVIRGSPSPYYSPYYPEDYEDIDPEWSTKPKQREIDNAYRHAVSVFPGVGYKLVFNSSQRTSFTMEVTGDVGFHIYSNGTKKNPDFFGEDWSMGTAGPRLSFALGVAF